MRVLIKIKPISTNNKIINYILQIIVVNVNGPVLDYSRYHKCLDLLFFDPDGSCDYLMKDVDSSLSCHKLLPYRCTQIFSNYMYMLRITRIENEIITQFLSKIYMYLNLNYPNLSQIRVNLDHPLCNCYYKDCKAKCIFENDECNPHPSSSFCINFFFIITRRNNNNNMGYIQPQWYLLCNENKSTTTYGKQINKNKNLI